MDDRRNRADDKVGDRLGVKECANPQRQGQGINRRWHKRQSLQQGGAVGALLRRKPLERQRIPQLVCAGRWLSPLDARQRQPVSHAVHVAGQL